MRIRRVSLLNLNSLRGEHSVDLGAEPFASAGLFAITGPTGAGKTTLLDAITLALYGRAARYSGDPNPEDMMSRHTGECRAEVEFEVGGATYRAAWHLHRARGAADGKVQPAKRYVYDASGEVLTQKLRDADTKIEEICGLDYPRFMRSVLLAQGEFARFLKSKPDERAALLESLTGTGLYSELSALAHDEHSRRERDLLENERALGLSQPLAAEERTDIEEGAKTATAKLAKARTDQKANADRLADADALATARGEEKKLLDRQVALELRREKADLSPLAAHRAATPFLPALEKVDSTTAALGEHEAQALSATRAATAATADHTAALAVALATGRKQISALEQALDQSRSRINTAEKARAATAAWLDENAADAGLKEALPALVESIATVAAARKTLAEHRSLLASLKEELSAARERQAAAAAAVAETKQTQAQTGEQVSALTTEFEKAMAGRDLTTRRNELEALRTLRAKRADLAAERKAHAAQKQALSAELARLPEAKNEEGKAVAALTDAERQVELLNRHLSDARLWASFEEQRATLADDAACPLCGAEDHPYCRDDSEPTAPGQLEKELASAKSRSDLAKRTHQAATKTITTLEAKLAEATKNAAKNADRVEALESDSEALGRELGLDASADLPALEKQRGAELDALSRAEKQLDDAKAKAAAATADLKQRTTESTAAAERSETVEKRIAKGAESIADREREGTTAADTLAAGLLPFSIDPATPDLRARLHERASTHAGREKELAVAKETLTTAQADEKSATKELTALRQHVAGVTQQLGDDTTEARPAADFDGALENARALELAAKEKAATATERERALAGSKKAQTSAAAALGDALAASDFADATALREARMEKDKAAAAESLERELSDQAQQLKGALASCRTTVEAQLAKSPPQGDALTALREDSKRAEENLESLTTELAELKAALKNDDALRARHTASAKELESQREQLGIWSQLSALIGSHDGKKFRVFAQGLTLDLLLRHANTHLARLEPRYLLSRHATAELEVEIVDTHQASTIRPMTSLSGGESFLASLALALGLSDLAGRNVQIDSLFIDEGFGSLDTATLDTALSALESLRAQDKTVGVISHVEMLKERIGVQIAVERAPDGSSELRISES